MKVLLVAEESAGIQVLRKLADSPHEVTAVLTSPPTRGGGAAVAGVADRLGLPVLPAQRVRDAEFAGWIRKHGVDLLVNVHSLVVMHPEVVRAPRLGSFNLHPGPLPRYAGLNAPSWALYHGERSHAVTVHRMEADIDTGAIAYESWFDVGDDETALSVAAECVRRGVPLIEQLLRDAERGMDAIPATEQDLTQRRYFGREPPEGARMVWSRPARTLCNLVRACDYAPFASPWGHPSTTLHSRAIGVTKIALTNEPTNELPGTVGPPDGDGIRVAAGDDWVDVQRVRVGNEPLSATAVLEPGMRLGDAEQPS